MIAINEDIFFEILTRLPVASLLRCKAVCRSWYNLISDPSFVWAHLDQSKKKRKLAAMPRISEQRMVDIYRYEEQDTCFSTCLFWKELPGMQGKSHVCHSDGLLLVDTRAELFICNPCTRDFTILPKGDADYRRPVVSGFGFVPGTNVLKVARYFYRSFNWEEGTCTTGFEVFTIGVDSSWRVMAKDPPCEVVFGTGNYVTCANGAIYFPIANTLQTTSAQFILSFDLRDENFSFIPPPSPLSSSFGDPNSSHYVIVLDDAPCVVYQPTEESKYTIWLYKEHTWIHAFTFQLSQGILCYPLIAVRYKKLLLRVFYGVKEQTWELFDPESKSFETVANITEHFIGGPGSLLDAYFYLVFSYVESLQPAGPKKKIEI